MTTVVDLVSPRDDISRAIFTIDYAHHEIHAGSSYTVYDVRNVDTTTFKWQITTPDSPTLSHATLCVEGTGEISVTFTEGSDRTDGTALTEINRNRESNNAAGVAVTHTPTGGSTDGSVTLLAVRVGTTSAGARTASAGGARDRNEFILARNTKYVVAAETFADIYVNLILDWYEH
jgi:hypothetical protein